MATYLFKARLWKYEGTAGWHFVTLPKTLSSEIRRKHGSSEEGWGRLKTLAKIGKSKWKTSIWFDSKKKSYQLPIKADVRRTLGAKVGNSLSVELSMELDRKSSMPFLGRI